MILTNKFKKDLISLINNNVGQIIKDINEIKESTLFDNRYVVVCVLVNGKIREGLVEKSIIDSLTTKIIKWI